VSAPTPSAPALAASLILLAPPAEGVAEGGAAGEGARVLLLKRSPSASFMPNALVFPGGRLEGSDWREADLRDPEVEAGAQGWGAWGFDSPLQMLAERRCAARETEEEAGIALTHAQVTNTRCVGRWLTPARLPKRFNTSFWLLALPHAPPPRVDGAEVVEGGWWAPREALRAYAEGRVELAPPTVRLLHDLAALCERPELAALHAAALAGDADALAGALSGGASAAPVCPSLVRDPARDLFALCLPGDDEYAGEEGALSAYRPAPSSPTHRLTRRLSAPQEPLRLVTSPSEPLYDLIGDVHGHADALEALLTQLGYAPLPSPPASTSTSPASTPPTYTHPEGRRLVFLGDLLDRGSQNERVIEIARAMERAGSALVIMGNHELNAIGYATARAHIHPPPAGAPAEFLRPHTPTNTHQHQKVLDEYTDPARYAALIAWLKTLPIWVDFGGFRAIHACWRASAMRALLDSGLVEERPLCALQRPLHQRDPHQALARATGGFIRFDLPEVERLYTKGDPLFEAIEVLLKGVEVLLPRGLSFHDKGGTERHHARVRWWLSAPPKVWADALIEPHAELNEEPFEGVDDFERYGDEVPLFVGHYWLYLGGPDAAGERPRALTPSVRCLDWSVTRGALVGFRLAQREGERAEGLGEFVWVRGDPRGGAGAWG
jgi:8-oxo-dGTP pyrophosphatase MutT (NUDIX family)